jgi:hypothetical protein
VLFLESTFWKVDYVIININIPFSGQKLDDNLQKEILENPNQPWHERYRKYLAFFIPFIFFHSCWLSLAIRNNLFRLYPIRWEMPVTMILGAFVSGILF